MTPGEPFQPANPAVRRAELVCPPDHKRWTAYLRFDPDLPEGQFDEEIDLDAHGSVTGEAVLNAVEEIVAREYLDHAIEISLRERHGLYY